MCDTLVALGNSTSNQKVLFAKNSDRDPNESQFPILEKGKRHPENSTVKCTYLEIPQAKETFTILLSKPFWMWGGEMGANEHGVVIGNEAVFTKVKKDSSPKLLGMDLLRLALERGKSAEEAMHVIIDLLEKYGQGGNCGFVHKLDYDNSYLIADNKEAWVLETADRQWAAEKVKDVRSISNRITIGNKWDLASTDLVHYAVDRGWCRKASDFNFHKCYSEPIFTLFSGSADRIDCTAEKLKKQKGNINLLMMMEVLRTHASDKNENWIPGRALVGSDVCMHFGFGPIRINQTTASMVSEIDNQSTVHWMTATSTPCMSIFKPIWMDAGLPEVELEATAFYDEKSFWWQKEILNRSILADYRERLSQISGELKAAQSSILEKAEVISDKNAETRRNLTNEVFNSEINLNKSWNNRVCNLQQKSRLPIYYKQALNSLNRQAKID